MPITSQAPKEWIDGFLFVGNHLALDFLNTRPSCRGPERTPARRGRSGSMARRVRCVAAQEGKTLARKWRDTPRAAVFLRELLKFRERLRAIVVRQEAGFSVSTAFIAELNSLLKQHPSVIALQRKGEKLDLDAAFETRETETTFGLPLRLPSPNCYRTCRRRACANVKRVLFTF